MNPETTVPEPGALPQSVEHNEENSASAEDAQSTQKPHRIADMPTLSHDWFIQELRRELAENRRREAEQDAG